MSSNLVRRGDVAEALYKAIRTILTGPFTDSMSLAIAMAKNIPSAEPERKKGEWTLYESRSDIYDLEGVCTWGRAYRCSECGFIHWVIEDFGIYSFCPNCGADMRGK